MSNRIPGHALRYEGAPHDDQGNRIYPSSLGWAGVSGKGRAQCSCGERSEVLPSAYRRKQWYVAHREAVKQQADTSLTRQPGESQTAFTIRAISHEAWLKGYAAGKSNAMRRMSDEPNAPTSPSPYCDEAVKIDV